jgi:hypothetical protein
MLRDDLIGSVELPLDMRTLSHETRVRSRLLLEAPDGATFVAGKIECSIGLSDEMPHVSSVSWCLPLTRAPLTLLYSCPRSPGCLHAAACARARLSGPWTPASLARS